MLSPHPACPHRLLKAYGVVDLFCRSAAAEAAASAPPVRPGRQASPPTPVFIIGPEERPLGFAEDAEETAPVVAAAAGAAGAGAREVCTSDGGAASAAAAASSALMEVRGAPAESLETCSGAGAAAGAGAVAAAPPTAFIPVLAGKVAVRSVRWGDRISLQNSLGVAEVRSAHRRPGFPLLDCEL